MNSRDATCRSGREVLWQWRGIAILASTAVGPVVIRGIQVLTSKGPWGGEGDRGYPEFRPETRANGQGVRVQEESCSGPGSKPTHSGHNTQGRVVPGAVVMRP